MEIRLNDDWSIKTDPYNYILQKRSVVAEDKENAGKEYWVNVAYFGRLEQLVGGLIEYEVKSSATNDLMELQVLVTNIEESIINSLEGVLN